MKMPILFPFCNLPGISSPVLPCHKPVVEVALPACRRRRLAGGLAGGRGEASLLKPPQLVL